MPLPSPILDDRRFEDLVQQAQMLIRTRCPAWTDFSASDPGTTLVEALAFLTDTMLYRLNRLPEKVYVALLNLLGVSPLPPAAARTTLTFKRAGDEETEFQVPAGTRIADGSGAITFMTTDDVTLRKGVAAIRVAAIHCDQIDAELVGVGTGAPEQSYRLRRAPLVRDLGDIWTVRIGVEAEQSEIPENADIRVHDGKTFAIWREVMSFAGLEPADRVFVLDRSDGLLTFAPSRGAGGEGSPTLATVPSRGREVRAWYRRGGGRQGNVVADTLTVFREPLPGLLVTNQERASGGEDGETVEQALARGRDAVRVLSSAVTAGDFERLALEGGGIARARAYAQRDVWSFGEPGVVEVRIVPSIDPSMKTNGAVTSDIIAAHQTDELAARVGALLARRRPLGVRTRVLWAGCRPVSISLRVIVSRTESLPQLRDRLLTRLNSLIAPDGGWPFGRSLRASDVYEAIVAEHGVRYAEQLRFSIPDAPQQGTLDIMQDRRQARTFFAASTNGLYRSMDNGRSWTRSLSPPEGRVILSRSHGEVPGLVLAVAETDGGLWPIYRSSDEGESWELLEQIQNEQVYDAAWSKRGERPILMLATRRGLRTLELGSAGGSKTIDRLGATSGPNDGFYAVAVGRHPLGVPMVAIAAREKGGVLLSHQGGEPGTFTPIPNSTGRDVRVLAFQEIDGRMFLWAGLSAEAGSEGEGAMRIEARAAGIDPGGWAVASKGWKGGSCEALDFLGRKVVAGSNRGGVLVLPSGDPGASWNAAPLDFRFADQCGAQRAAHRLFGRSQRTRL